MILVILRGRSQHAKHEQVVIDAAYGESLRWLMKAGSLHVQFKLITVEVLIILKV